MPTKWKISVVDRYLLFDGSRRGMRSDGRIALGGGLACRYRATLQSRQDCLSLRVFQRWVGDRHAVVTARRHRISSGRGTSPGCRRRSTSRSISRSMRRPRDRHGRSLCEAYERLDSLLRFAQHAQMTGVYDPGSNRRIRSQLFVERLEKGRIVTRAIDVSDGDVRAQSARVYRLVEGSPRL
jgi:hypothetical protein